MRTVRRRQVRKRTIDEDDGPPVLVGRYGEDEEPPEHGGPVFLDDGIHRSDFEAYLRVRVSALEPDLEKARRVLGGWRPAKIHRTIGNAYYDVRVDDGTRGRSLKPRPGVVGRAFKRMSSRGFWRGLQEDEHFGRAFKRNEQSWLLGGLGGRSPLVLAFGMKARATSGRTPRKPVDEDGPRAGTLVTHVHHLQIRKALTQDLVDVIRGAAKDDTPGYADSAEKSFETDEAVEVCVDGTLPELWGRVSHRLGLQSEFMTYSDFLAMQTLLAGADSQRTRSLLATMDARFFVESYPWWEPLFDRFAIARGGGGGCGCSDEGPLQALSCQLCGCGC